MAPSRRVLAGFFGGGLAQLFFLFLRISFYNYLPCLSLFRNQVHNETNSRFCNTVRITNQAKKKRKKFTIRLFTKKQDDTFSR